MFDKCFPILIMDHIRHTQGLENMSTSINRFDISNPELAQKLVINIVGDRAAEQFELKLLGEGVKFERHHAILGNQTRDLDTALEQALDWESRERYWNFEFPTAIRS